MVHPGESEQHARPGIPISDYRFYIREAAESHIEYYEPLWLFNNRGELDPERQRRWSNCILRELSACAVLLQYTAREDYDEHTLRAGIQSWYNLNKGPRIGSRGSAKKFFFEHNVDVWSTGFGTVAEDHIVTAQFAWRPAQTYLSWFEQDFRVGGNRYSVEPGQPPPSSGVFDVRFPDDVTHETIFKELT